MTANMLAAYYSKGADSEALFSKLEISKDPSFKDHLNKYDVIHLDIQWIMEIIGGVNNIVPAITKEVLEELGKYYPGILPDGITSLADALSRINIETGNRFIIIIDEWDVLIRDDANNQKVQDDYIDFLRSLFKGTEPTKFIALAYMIGILPIKRVKTQSALNNFNEYTMINPGPLADYMGFTEDEVKALCVKYARNFDDVKRWYDGYLIGGCHVYNPKAVVSAMLTGVFMSYWSATSSYDAVVPYINLDFDGLRESIIEMISGGETPVDVTGFQNDAVSFVRKDDVLTYLIHLGYLGYDSAEETAFIPNEEIRIEMRHAVEVNPWKEMIKFMDESASIVDATLDMDAETVAEGIGRIHEDYIPVIKYNNENSLANVLTLAYLESMDHYFKPKRELPSGRGFVDFAYIPKPRFVRDYPALVIELKWNKSSNTALNQIKDRNYPESIKEYTDNILLVGINYDKKTKKHECVIEKLEK